MNKVTPSQGGTKSIFQSKRVKVLSALLAVLILGALAFGLPYTVSDGTEKFTGKEARVAKWAIGDGSYETNTNPIPDLAVGFRAKIANITKSEPEHKCGPSKQGTTYIVETDKVTFFGILAPGYETPYCVTN